MMMMMKVFINVAILVLLNATSLVSALVVKSSTNAAKTTITNAIIKSSSSSSSCESSLSQQQQQQQLQSKNDACNRRSFFSVTAASALVTFGIVGSSSVMVEPCNAFANKISDKYDDRPKQRGSQPKDLGVANRLDVIEDEEYIGLKVCGAKPNCFSSTDRNDGYHSIPSWKWPTKIFGDGDDEGSIEKAFQDLLSVLENYEPGQNNIDGGGFQIVQKNLKSGYIYVQYQALKNGYIDDFELAYIKDGSKSNSNAVQIRSSSRLGYLDYGVNAKRINYIATKLREKKWDAPGVDFSTHREYAQQNGI